MDSTLALCLFFVLELELSLESKLAPTVSSTYPSKSTVSSKAFMTDAGRLGIGGLGLLDFIPPLRILGLRSLSSAQLIQTSKPANSTIYLPTYLPTYRPT